MSGIVNSSTGMERLAREALIILLETANTAIQQQAEMWGPLDEELAALREVDYEEIEIEEIPKPNFHLGVRPSLIKAPIDAFPNLTVMSDQAQASDIDEVDQMNKYSISMFIELFVRGGDEAEVNARIQRTAEAINICILSNPTLRGYAQEIGATPSIGITDVNTRKENTSYGSEWFLQGARIEYLIEKEANRPQGGMHLATAPVPQYEIDQV